MRRISSAQEPFVISPCGCLDCFGESLSTRRTQDVAARQVTSVSVRGALQPTCDGLVRGADAEPVPDGQEVTLRAAHAAGVNQHRLGTPHGGDAPALSRTTCWTPGGCNHTPLPWRATGNFVIDVSVNGVWAKRLRKRSATPGKVASRRETPSGVQLAFSRSKPDRGPHYGRRRGFSGQSAPWNVRSNRLVSGRVTK